MLFELVYNSVANPITLGEPDLQKILQGARQHNIEVGVTGVLLCHRGEFVQLLEGERDAVEHVYNDIILKDRRHRAANLCWDAAIEERSFSNWSMGYAAPASLDAANTPGLDGYLAGGVAALDLSGPGSFGRKMLISIYKQIENASSR